MTPGKWKDFAELLAMVAVIASLAAIAFELRQTQTAFKGSSAGFGAFRM